MGERRLSRRTPEKSGGLRFEDEITVIDDNPVLVVPILQEPEPKPTKISLPSVKPKGGGASKRWGFLIIPWSFTTFLRFLSSFLLLVLSNRILFLFTVESAPNDTLSTFRARDSKVG